jgi:hypothetical protein
MIENRLGRGGAPASEQFMEYTIKRKRYTENGITRLHEKYPRLIRS